MGIDIRCFVEVKRGDAWQCVRADWPSPGYRNSRVFALIGHPHCAPAGFPRIAAPRGIPPDISAEVRAASGYCRDEHFYQSWLTLGELLRYDYQQVVSRQRVVTVWEDRDDEPCYLAPEREDEGEWKDFTLREETGASFPKLLQQLERDWGDPDRVRLVFWFDQDRTAAQAAAAGSST